MSQNDSQTHHHNNNVETKTTLQTPPLSSKPHPILTLQLKESQDSIFPSNSNTLFAKTMTSTNSTSTEPLPSSDDIAAKAVNKRYEGLVTVQTKAIKGKGAWYWTHLEPILVRNPNSGLPKSVKLKCSLCEAVFSASNPSRTASEHLKRGTCSNFNKPLQFPPRLTSRFILLRALTIVNLCRSLSNNLLLLTSVTAAGIPASGYNPLLGTFHTLDILEAPSSSPIHSNGRFQNIDETGEHPGNSVVAGVEYDSVSNNGSWSGESEDHKEKTSNPPVRLEAVPGADNDKREEIRQTNERKHQRQKERRAQELREKCRGYLMSRKLETLAQQFVAMGFSQERATMALVLNEGRVEESIAWLFESGEEDGQNDKTAGRGGNLKIDILETPCIQIEGAEGPPK